MENLFTVQMWTVLCVALLLQLIQYPFLGRLVWPRWKLFGKIFFYLFVSLVFHYYAGAWAWIFVIGHPGIGIISFLLWCKKYDLDWRRVDSEEYIRLQKETLEKWNKKDT